ncbi:WXG100 family type VII secretion target [Mycobacterium syngnathidarum]
MPQVSRSQAATPQNLRVDPDDLSDSSTRIARLVTDLRLGHDAAHGRMEAAQSGHVGSSALALRGLVEKWRADTTILVERLQDHGQAFGLAAQAYRETDSRCASAIEFVGKSEPCARP